MIAADSLALDSDGVLCDGMAEYLETGRRAAAKVWPGEPAPGDELLPAFPRLRSVIMMGWEMPLLLRAITPGQPEGDILRDWKGVWGGEARAAYTKQAIRDTLIEHKEYIARDGDGMPETAGWTWGRDTATSVGARSTETDNV